GVPSGNYSIPVKGSASIRDLPRVRAAWQAIGEEIVSLGPVPQGPPPAGAEGYVRLSRAAAALNLSGTVSNGGYGLGLSRGWAPFRNGAFVENLFGIVPSDDQWATPDVANALEAAVH